MKKMIKNIPIIGPLIKNIYRKYINPRKPVTSSENYWKERYDSGGNSGDGSYRKLAEFKAEIVNGFINEEKIKTIIEYGCGDGNQLKLANYPSYIGFDVSPKTITLCKEIFVKDSTKVFNLMIDYKGESAQLTLSLDVIYHLIEDNVFNDYMHRLFNSSEKYVVIYSSNINKNQIFHVRHRKFSEWIEKQKPTWKLLKHIPNRYPYKGDDETGSFADFYIYKKSN